MRRILPASLFGVAPAAFIALSGLNGAAWAQTPGTQPCTLPKIADTAPLEQLAGTDLVTVPVAINGNTRKFLLDLGLKKPTEVSQKMKAELGLGEPNYLTENFGSGITGVPGINNVRVYDATHGLGAGALTNLVSVGSFTVGRATGRHLQFAVAKKGEIGPSAPYDGFLTGDFFRQYDVELDFGGKQMTWLTPTDCSDPNRVVFWPHREVAIVPITLAKDGRLQMQVMVHGHIFNAEIDTSSARSVMRRDIAERYVRLTSDTPDMTPVNGLKDGVGMQIYVHTFPEIIFSGGITVLNIPTLIQNYSMIPMEDRRPVLGTRAQFTDERIPDLTIGMDVLQKLHMYVVLGQGKIYVTSASNAVN
jgi:hypothetical protein